MNANLLVPYEALERFCRENHIQRLYLFGSALRGDFRPDSDIDLVAEFADGERHSLFDLARMDKQLREIFRREVDFIDRRALEQSENALRRENILQSMEPLYEAG